jgi:pSer/pThr/pTyr-binding forkhead associated (FHA) protein
MRMIHHQCLKQWFAQKRLVKESHGITTYFWKNLECELCKQPYPYETRYNNQMLNIIDYALPHSHEYIVLESISTNTSKVIHVVNMALLKKVYIGRGHDAEVRVTDISVSRLHAFIFKKDGLFYLSDNKSKFGTLALIRYPVLLREQMQFQISRSLLSTQEQKPT